jgi:hypothetical protein
MTTTDIATPAPAEQTIVVDELVADRGVYGLYRLVEQPELADVAPAAAYSDGPWPFPTSSTGARPAEAAA